MFSCDAFYISKILNDITYDEIILSAGLNNSICSIEYDNTNVYMLKGRNFNSITDLFNKLQIQYKKITAIELFEEQYRKNFQNIVIVIPKVIFDNIDLVDAGSTQLSFSTSTYIIKEFVDDSISLIGMDNDKEYEKTVEYSSLEKLSTIKLKPEGEGIQIFILEKTNCTKKAVSDNILNSMQACLYHCYDYNHGDFLYSSGEGGYQKICQSLQKYAALDSTTKKILIGSMVSGTNFFYRREYAEALEKSYDFFCESVNNLKLAGGYWRKITRYLLNNLLYSYPVSVDIVEETMNKIKYLEMNFFEDLSRKIV